jgi:hypothetical protein
VPISTSQGQIQSAVDNAKTHNDADLSAVFGFAKALATGYAFINRQQSTHFIGYRSSAIIHPGTVLLDATSDIDGISQLCPWRTHQEVPRARYDNLSIIHVQPPNKGKNLTEWLKSAKRKREYVQWLVPMIKEHMQPGQKGLVVVKKTLIDNEFVPAWPQSDPRHDDHKLYTEDWGWEIEGRKLCAVHWGTGIGQNTWRDADVVFLCDDFVLPRRVVIAAAQGLGDYRSTEGPLGSMRDHNNKSPAVDLLQVGHELRWMKQMALRGKGRSYDGNGSCAPQKLVYAGNLKNLLRHSEDLFPGAKAQYVKGRDTKQTQEEALLSILSRPGLPHRIDQSWLGQQLGRPWREVSKHLMKKPTVLKAIATLGWTYRPGRGGRGSHFERAMKDTVGLAA